MTVKIYLNEHIHRVSKLPTTLEALKTLIQTLFKNELPQSWSVQYVDQDGDKITVSHEQDYKELVELETNSPATIFKLYIAAAELGKSQEITKEAKIEKLPEASQRKISEEKNIEEEKWEKIENIENPKAEKPEKFKKEKFEKVPKCKEFGQAKKILKKILKGKLSEAEKTEANQQLEQIISQFTPEQREVFEAKRERFEMKMKFVQQIRAELKGETQGEVKYETDANGKPIHSEVTCDGCQTKPVVGVRYKCSVCKGFNFCEVCEETKEHTHPFLKLRTPSRFGGKFGKCGKKFERGGCKGGKFGMMKEMIAKIKQQSPEKAETIFDSVRTFFKLSKAKRKGNTEKIEKCQTKLLSLLPEENRKAFEESFASLPQGKNLAKGEVKEKLAAVMKSYYQVYCPENNNIFEELEQMKKERKEKKEEWKKMMKEKRGGECKRGFFGWEKKKELKEKYDKPVFKTAIMMKFKLPNEDIEKLCEYVKQAPVDLTLEQLIEKYN